jgi:hypothetical protein
LRKYIEDVRMGTAKGWQLMEKNRDKNDKKDSYVMKKEAFEGMCSPYEQKLQDNCR